MKVCEVVNVSSGWKQVVGCLAFFGLVVFFSFTFRISAVVWIPFPSFI